MQAWEAEGNSRRGGEVTRYEVRLLGHPRPTKYMFSATVLEGLVTERVMIADSVRISDMSGSNDQ